MFKNYLIISFVLSFLLFGCKIKTEVTSQNEFIVLSESNQNIPLEILEECTNIINLNQRTTTISPNQYALIFPTYIQATSSMNYCSERINTKGSIFEVNYVDPGGNGMDGYVNSVIGGVQQNGSWQVGDFNLTGMPILLSDLHNSMIFQWKSSQTNALEDNDKWMASINLIFDDGDINEKPENANRDYDLVIELNSHNFNNSTEDVTEGNKRNYFARNTDGSLRTFDISVKSVTYKYAVRYKFYYNSGDKNNKVHVKYIPINETNIPPYLNHSLKAFITNSKEFIQYANMPNSERILANEKVAKSSLYLKSIRAGYEVYKGESTLKNDFFRVVF
jgi:hypothetical protein